jgi:hypothetical protein
MPLWLSNLKTASRNKPVKQIRWEDGAEKAHKHMFFRIVPPLVFSEAKSHCGAYYLETTYFQ